MAKASSPTPSAEDPANDVELGVLNRFIGFRIRRIQNHISRSFSERIADKEVRPGLFSALALIAANPGLSQTTLAREIGFDKATVVALLDALEKLKWAERRRSVEDRRRHSLHITAKGEKALVHLCDVAEANEAAINAALSKAEQAQLFGLLDKIYGVCFSDEA